MFAVYCVNHVWIAQLVDGANAILALGCVILRYRFDDFRARRAMPR